MASAVDDARDGDVISIAGEFLSYTSTENINITKNITLKTGEYFSGSAKYIQGSKGGVIYVEKGGSVTVKGVTFSNNYASDGSDIYAAEGTGVTIPCTVTANCAGGVTVKHSYTGEVKANNDGTHSVQNSVTVIRHQPPKLHSLLTAKSKRSVPYAVV